MPELTPIVTTRKVRYKTSGTRFFSDGLKADQEEGDNLLQQGVQQGRPMMGAGTFWLVLRPG